MQRCLTVNGWTLTSHISSIPFSIPFQKNYSKMRYQGVKGVCDHAWTLLRYE